MKRDSFILYPSFYRPISTLTDEQLGRLFRALFLYNLEEEFIIADDIRMAFEFFRNQMDIDYTKWLKKCEKLANNAKSKQKKTNANKSNQIGGDNENDNENDNDNDNENVNVNDNVIEKKKRSPQKFIEPTIAEIQEYCKERGNNIDAEQFYAFYKSKGWKVGSHQMKDWKAAVITWEKRNKKTSSARKYPSEEYRRMIEVPTMEDWANERGTL